MSNDPLNPLNERQQNFCTYGGTFGILITVTCLIQHLVVTKSNWITNSMVLLYAIIAVFFLLLALQKSYSPYLIIAGGVFALVMQYIWMRHLSFSLAVLLLFIYHVVILVALYTEQVPYRLKLKRKAELEEEQKWAGKL
ncbi:MAG: hypothetical protein NTW29_10110 [Bacteroidetes bacterium]|nr:hypothetical protein [Bacteroidota bacterium]